MQVHLSHLLDLALGSPDNLNYENFDMLHTLLHVLLKKLNLRDSCIELCKDTAENIELLQKELPNEASICFREYVVRPDGCKIRKKSCLSVGPRKSLMHVNKKWPKCQTKKTPIASRDENPTESTSLVNKFNQALKCINVKIIQIEEKLSNLSSNENHPSNSSEGFINTRNCELKINIQKIEENGSDSDVYEEVSIDSQTHWLKKKVFDLADSLKLHSNCLKKLKCVEIPNILSRQQELMDIVKKNFCILENIEQEKQKMILNFNQIRNAFENFEQQISSINDHVKSLEDALGIYKTSTDSELCSLKLTMNQRKHENLAMNFQEMSDIINVQNLQSSDIKSDSNRNSKINSCEKLENGDENQKIINEFLNSLVVSSVSKHECTGKAPNKPENSSTSTLFSLNGLMRQVSSQSICMHQIARDLSLKMDRKEFECYRRELNDIIDAFVQLKKDIQSTPIAAGCAIPLIKNLNCISCQASTQMTITAGIPKIPSLSFGRGRINTEYCHEDNQKCFEKGKCQRRVGGCHTKISQKMNVSRMKFKRLCTPYKCCTPRTAYQNRYRKTNFHCY